MAMVIGGMYVTSETSNATPTVTICHQGETWEVPHSLVWQHFKETGGTQPNHDGDYFGTCLTTTTTVPTTTTTTTPTPTPPVVPPAPPAPPVPTTPDFTG